METARIQTGATEVLDVFAVNAAGNPLTGLTDLYVRIRRQSDGYFLDWADMTFKNAAWTTINGVLAEVSATYAAGLYSRSLNTGSITNVSANDTYEIIPVQTPGATARLPAPGELKVGQYVDRLDAAVTTRATQAQILSDATPFQGARIDATISSRATQAQILSDATPFQGARIDAAISSRSTLDGAGVQSAMTSQGYTAARGPKLDQLDAAVSSRAAPGAAMDLVTDAVDAAALAADAVTEIRDGILDDATRFHGASVAAILADTAAMDGRLPSDPADESLQQAAHGVTQGAIAALNNLSQAGVQSAMTAQGYTAARGPKLDQLDAAVSSRSTLMSAQAADAVWDELLSGHVTVGSAGKALADAGTGDPSAIADAVWDELLSGHTTVGSAGKTLSDAGTGGDPAVIADAVWDEALSGHVGAGSAGQAQGRLDVGVSTRAAPGANMGLTAGAVTAAAMTTGAAQVVRDQILSDSTPFQGARVDAAISSRAAPGAAMDLVAGTIGDVVDGVWDEPTSGHLAAGSTGKALIDAGATSDPSVIAAAVWDEPLAGHAAPGSTGEALTAAKESEATGATIADAPTVWPPAAGSLLDRLANAGPGQTYDPTTDSLEAVRNRIG